MAVFPLKHANQRHSYNICTFHNGLELVACFQQLPAMRPPSGMWAYYCTCDRSWQQLFTLQLSGGFSSFV